MSTKIAMRDLNLYYGGFQALKHLNMEIPANQITAFIGPSGCGKSTCIKTINRMNDLVNGCRIEGKVEIDGEDIYDPRTDVTLLRRRAGMVFQKPNPFPMSIYDNIAYGPRVHGIKNRKKLDELVENSLRGAALWEEVKDRLKESALGMSGGQQQRLCIARALAVQPDILKIEDLMQELKKTYTVVIVTHNMQQAGRIADRTAFFLLGEIVEYDDTAVMFNTPHDKRTEDYITGRFG